ncbi:hypothetical protein [Hyphomonas sp.]|uniref:hypothetical protein n=1 Tax=Hyphomonas sp. TaxID=87 RepID=UPI0035278BD2
MTDEKKKLVDRLIVVTTADSCLKSKIAELKTALCEQHTSLSPSYFKDFDLNQVFPNVAGDGDKDRYNEFIRHLVQSQLAIIDLSFAEASFYVLGIRQAVSNGMTIALAPSSDVPTCADSRFTDAPQLKYVDTNGGDWIADALRMAESLGNPQGEPWTNDLQKSNTFRTAPIEREFDTKGLDIEAWRLHDEQGNPLTPEVIIWKHDIRNATQFDVWVNSENTYMEMARFWDRSVSAVIRKLGSVRQPPYSEHRRKDALGLALAERMGTRTTVPIGTVFVTPTDSASTLGSETGNNVKYVAHLAAVEPDEVGYGFRSGGRIVECVVNVLCEIEKVRNSRSVRQANRTAPNLESVLFPLIGSGDGGAHPSLVAHQMVGALTEIIRGQRKSCGQEHLKRIGLVAYQPSHFDYIVRELSNHGFTPHPIETK